MKENINKKKILSPINRRKFLAIGAATGMFSAIGAPAVHSSNRSITVGAFGGYFKDAFDEFVFPEFTKATGIELKSVAQPTSSAWVVQLEQAARAGKAPADVSMIAQAAMLMGYPTRLWTPLNVNKIPSSSKVLDQHTNFYDSGELCGVGAASWFITLCSNTEIHPTAPDSWKFLWDEKNADSLGLLALVQNSFLLEVTAKTFYGNYDAMNSEEGILELMQKLSELKSNVKLWYRDEAQFQNALETGELAAGQYYHDVTMLSAADGKPVRSTFPKEGGINDSGSWAISKASEKIDEGHEFIDFMCQPQIQALMSRMVGTAPIVPKETTDLTDEEFGFVSSEIDPIIPNYAVQNQKKDWLAQNWSEIVTAG